MRYCEYEIAFSPARLSRFVNACKGNKTKSLQLYRYNIKLCEQFYGLLSVFEVLLRNTINSHYKNFYGDPNWIRTQLSEGGFLEQAPQKEHALQLISKLTNSGIYTNDKIVSNVSFGFWPYMFTRHPFRLGGQSLLRIFPCRTPGTNQRTVFNELQQIKNFRNRIAHHEPICFGTSGNIDTKYAYDNYQLILKYIRFFGYNPQELFFGINSQPDDMLSAISALAKRI